MNIFSVPFPDIFLGGGGGEKLDNADSKGRNNSKLNFTQVSNHERKLKMKRFSKEERETLFFFLYPTSTRRKRIRLRKILKKKRKKEKKGTHFHPA